MHTVLSLIDCLCHSPAALAAEPAPAPLESVRFLEGSWSGPGTGQWGDFTQQVVVRPILDQRGLQLNISNGDFDMVGLLVVDAAGDWKGTWADEAGVIAQYTGRISEEGKRPSFILTGSFTWEGNNHQNERRWTLNRKGKLDYTFTVTSGGSAVVTNRSTLTPTEKK
jgi:hypothetical protein